MRALPILLFVVSAPAFAQSTDLEYRAPEAPKGNQRLTVGGDFESAWFEYDNMDLRPRDESSDQAILDSDDRNGFAFTGAGLDLRYKVEDSLDFVFAANHRGLWGNDQIGGVSQYGSMMYVSGLYVDWRPSIGDWTPEIRVGRQFYSLGGLGGSADYELADTLDMVRIDLPFGESFHIELIPVNVVGLSGENDNANFFSYIGQSTTQTFGLRGDHMTRRHGAVAVFAPKKGPEVRAYVFYTDIGALGSGSDISYDGQLGNFSDNDWVMNVGARAEWTLADAVTPFVSVDYSLGIDRKELVARDVDTSGLAFSAGATFDTRGDDKDDGVSGEVSYYEAFGSAYAEDGLMYSHGHVGMKARQVGGLVADRFMGWHPSAYVGMFGVSDDPHDIDRKAGTRVIHAGGRWDAPGVFAVDVGYWFLQDTGVTYFDLSTLDTVSPPYGYSAREFAAEERMGKVLGHEIDVGLSARASKHLSFHIDAGVLLPGEYYAIEVDRVAGDQLGGQAAAWAGSGGLEVEF